MAEEKRVCPDNCEVKHCTCASYCYNENVYVYVCDLLGTECEYPEGCLLNPNVSVTAKEVTAAIAEKVLDE